MAPAVELLSPGPDPTVEQLASEGGGHRDSLPVSH